MTDSEFERPEYDAVTNLVQRLSAEIAQPTAPMSVHYLKETWHGATLALAAVAATRYEVQPAQMSDKNWRIFDRWTGWNRDELFTELRDAWLLCARLNEEASADSLAECRSGGES